jgi:hypothetical protein
MPHLRESPATPRQCIDLCWIGRSGTTDRPIRELLREPMDPPQAGEVIRANRVVNQPAQLPCRNGHIGQRLLGLGAEGTGWPPRLAQIGQPHKDGFRLCCHGCRV